MSTPQPLAGLSILVVEDDDDGRELFEMFLTHVGAIVRTAPTAEEALHTFKVAPSAAVVTDITLRGQDGFWLLNQLRSLPGAERVPVVAITGRALPREHEAIRAAGFDAQMLKPFDLNDAVRIIAAVTRPKAR